jgi:metal-responsive CopG/Arc/MetJ family transcriptional regulator
LDKPERVSKTTKINLGLPTELLNEVDEWLPTKRYKYRNRTHFFVLAIKEKFDNEKNKEEA